MVDMKLEVVILPVDDVDRAKKFYEKAGFNLDVDHQPTDSFRVVQFTPPGSSCSVTFGTGLGFEHNGPVGGMHLVVDDMEAAVQELSGRSVETTAIRHMGPEGWVDGPDPERRNYATYSGFTDTEGNEWVLQEVGYGSSREEGQT